MDKNEKSGTTRWKFLYNLKQRTGYVGPGSGFMPALLRSSQIYNALRGRMMHPWEHLAVQQIPVLLPKCKHQCAFQSLLNNKLFTDAEIKSFAGNGMNLQVACMVFLYSFACTELVKDRD